jgi:hypothetical protein
MLDIQEVVCGPKGDEGSLRFVPTAQGHQGLPVREEKVVLSCYDAREPWGWHPSHKTAGSPDRHPDNQGRTPITKNIRVVDDAGNPLQSTYPKRALGLVKHGRARFIDDQTIQMTRPPDPREKETTMHTQEQDHSNTATVPFGGRDELPKPQTSHARELTANDILQRIDMLIGETAYLRESVDALARIESGGVGEAGSPGDIGTQAKARAIASVIEQRELTNQKMIALLDRMFDDLSPTMRATKQSRNPDETKLIERLIDQAGELSEETLAVFLEKLT